MSTKTLTAALNHLWTVNLSLPCYVHLLKGNGSSFHLGSTLSIVTSCDIFNFLLAR